MTDNASAVPADNKKSKADTLLAEVAANIEAGKEQVIARVVSAMVEKKLVARAELLGKAIDKLGFMRKEMYMLGPDQVSYGTDDRKIETFSKERKEARTRHEESLNRLGDVIEKALTDGKEDAFKKLHECMDKLSKGDKKSE